ncbi:disulfide bond formation protein DsbD [Cytophagaceae bacterium SJW1-29]|uniref:Disulfide bond formation protein DsbD n=2 Tax=Salmonirosea aquatica TaxID=2654236 RepID=A0A7C9FDH1_9BACT|nr:disulfide bond formation protein DsbD [Cytophagaceae bacterium SJW1-29]
MLRITAAVGALVLFLNFPALAQVQRHATWTQSFSKSEVKVGETVDLIFKATIDPGWYLYSSDFAADLGPTLTEITLTPDASFEKVGKLKPINPKKKFEEVWQGDVTYFTGKAEFRQTVRILKQNPVIKAAANYQTCSEISGLCVLGDNNFVFTGLKVGPADQEEKPKTETAATSPATDETFAEAVQESLIDSATSSGTEGETSVDTTNRATLSSTKIGLTGEEGTADNSLWAFAIAAFLAGLVALLTPCVFPIIPMTVSFFTKQKGGKTKALVYGLSIILIYTLIGTIVSRINGPAFANFLSTHWLPNLLFFAIFFLFGLSFLGLFEIVLPSSLVNKMDEKADQGGYLGVFFMAFTLVLVSFSCTGPIVGSLLVASAGGEVLKPIVGMVAFSSAFAIPFTLFALFPQWLKSLPKSGGWLNTVKVVLGFLELALALKFLSIADQVYHWRLLDREIFLAFWIVIFGMLGSYLLGKIRTPHDSPTEVVSVPRILLAIATFTFVVYMIPGMWGAPLKALAGYLPPQATHDFDLNRRAIGTAAVSTLGETPKYNDLFDLPHELEGFFDYEQALAYAKKVNKPVFIDFTGHGCVNCREMEARVWSDPAVLQHLRNDFVIAALYVDDKTELPESAWYTSPYDQRIKKTIGAQNADLQITKFNNNAQPHYVLLSPDGNLLVPPKNYDLDPGHFVAFLESGKAKMQ